jgi:hypothetical protein
MYTPYLSTACLLRRETFEGKDLERPGKHLLQGKEHLFPKANLQDNRFRLRQAAEAANPGAQIECILAQILHLGV